MVIPGRQQIGIITALDAVRSRGDEAAWLLRRKPESLTPSEWNSLSMLAESGLVGGSTVPETVGTEPGLQVLATHARAMADGETQVGIPLRTIFEHVRVSTMTTTDRANQLHAMLDRDPTSLARTDWIRLNRLLAHEAAAPSTDRVSLTLPGLSRFELTAASNAALSRPTKPTFLFFDDFAVRKLDAAQRASQRTELLGRLDRLTDPEWVRLTTLLANDATGARISLPLAGDLLDLARNASLGKLDPAKVDMHVQRFAVDAMDDAARQADIGTLLERARSGDELLAADRHRLHAHLVDDVLSERILAPRTMRDQPHLEYALGPFDHEQSVRILRHYAEFDRLARMSPEAIADEGATLVAGDWAALSTSETRRMAAIIELHRSAARRLAIPGTLATRIVDDARRVADGLPGAVDDLVADQVRYRAFRQAADAPVGTHIEYLRSVRERTPTPLPRAEGERFVAALDAIEASGERGVVRSRLMDMSMLVAAGRDVDPAKLAHSLAVFLTSLESPQSRRAAAAELMTHDPGRMAPEQWGRLAAMLESDPGRHVLVGPREMAGTPTLEYLAQRHARGEGLDPGVARYFAAWNAASEASTWPEATRQAIAVEILRKDPNALDPEDWRRLTALLDSDPHGATIQVKRSLEGHGISFADAARRLADGQPYDERVAAYFKAWAITNDPAYRIALDESITRLVAGGSTAADARTINDAIHLAPDLAFGIGSDDARLAVALMQLNDDKIAGSMQVEPALGALRSILVKRPPTSPALVMTHAEAVRLLDVNLERLAGRTPSGAVRGYASHPDYAEIGQVRANVELLRRLGQLNDAQAGAVQLGDTTIAW